MSCCGSLEANHRELLACPWSLRNALRNLERAGVPQSTAMAMVGHKTASIYRRYAIIDEAVIREGSEKLAALHAGQSSGQSALKARPEVLAKLAEGEGFEPPRASRPGGFQVHCLAS
jgi:uroporphyrinogen-III synthase